MLFFLTNLTSERLHETLNDSKNNLVVPKADQFPKKNRPRGLGRTVGKLPFPADTPNIQVMEHQKTQKPSLRRDRARGQCVSHAWLVLRCRTKRTEKRGGKMANYLGTRQRTPVLPLPLLTCSHATSRACFIQGFQERGEVVVSSELAGFCFVTE